MLRQFPLSLLGLSAGGILTVIGIVAYIADYATLNLVGFFYGIPLLLGGLALKTAELKPVPYSQPPAEKVIALRSQQATATQNKVRQDVTGYRYGQNLHLDSTLTYLGLGKRDEEKPLLKGVREEEIEGAYALVLEFDSPRFALDVWQQKQPDLERYFGPGIQAKISAPKEGFIEIALIALIETSPNPS